MIRLGIVCATKDLSIAVLEENIVLCELNLRRDKIDDLVLLIERTLQDSGKSIKEVDEYVVVNGPGSYGGIRNSLTAIKVLAMVNNKSIKTVNFLELLAYQHKEYLGLIVVVTESRKGEVNYGLYGGGVNLNTIIVSDTIKKDILYNKLIKIEEPFLVIGDLYEAPDFNQGSYLHARPSASEAIFLANNCPATDLNQVAPIYAYPVNVNTSSKKYGTKK
jgi:tRNA threonylcarbamoyl adenosine modification protein YeaZ